MDIVENKFSFVGSWEECESGEVGVKGPQHLRGEGGTKGLHPEKRRKAPETGKSRLEGRLAVMCAFHC